MRNYIFPAAPTAVPNAPLMQASDGSFYGDTEAREHSPKGRYFGSF